MSISREASHYLDMRDNMTEDEKDFIDEVYRATMNAKKTYGIKLANDDRSEEFEAALIKWMVDSRS